jgi:hypothetical protein
LNISSLLVVAGAETIEVVEVVPVVFVPEQVFLLRLELLTLLLLVPEEQAQA